MQRIFLCNNMSETVFRKVTKDMPCFGDTNNSVWYNKYTEKNI